MTYQKIRQLFRETYKLLNSQLGLIHNWGKGQRAIRMTKVLNGSGGWQNSHISFSASRPIIKNQCKTTREEWSKRLTEKSNQLLHVALKCLQSPLVLLDMLSYHIFATYQIGSVRTIMRSSQPKYIAALADIKKASIYACVISLLVAIRFW